MEIIKVPLVDECSVLFKDCGSSSPSLPHTPPHRERLYLVFLYIIYICLKCNIVLMKLRKWNESDAEKGYVISVSCKL